MAQVTLPYNLTAGSPENVANLMSNLNALKDGVNTIDTAQIATSAVTTAKLAAVPACRVRRNATQVFTTQTYVFASFDTEVFDTDGMFAATDTKITIKTAGIYAIHASVTWPDSDGVGDPVNYAIIEKNATAANNGTKLLQSGGTFPSSSLDSFAGFPYSTTASLALNDTISLTLYNGSGSDEDFGGANAYALALSVTWIGKS